VTISRVLRSEEHMSQQWYYSRGRTKNGPVSVAGLRQLAAEGRLAPNDMVWTDGMADWAAAGSLSGLFPAPPKIPPPAPPTLPMQVEAPAPAPSPVPTAASDNPLAGMHRQRLAIGAAAIAGVAATFLPWAHIGPLSVYGTAGDGWLTLALFVPAIVQVLRGSKGTALVGGARLWAVIPAGLAALIGLAKIATIHGLLAFPVVLGDPDTDPFSMKIKGAHALVRIGIGLYLEVAAGGGLCLGAWLLEKPTARLGAGQARS
jgi:hypothetical protein